MKKFLVALGACTAIISSVVLGAPLFAGKNSPDWTAGEPSVGQDVAQVSPTTLDQTCVTQRVSVGNYPAADVCITQMDGWRYGLYKHPYNMWGMTMYDDYFVIGLGSDTNMYIARGLPLSDSTLKAPGTNSLIYRNCCGQYVGSNTISVYPNLPSLLTKTTGPSGVEYTLKADAAKTAYMSDGPQIHVEAAAVSSNGHWLVGEMPNRGLIRVNLQTFEVKRFSNYTANYDWGHSANVALAISDDGGTVFMGGKIYGNRQFRVYDVTDTCGDDAPANTLMSSVAVAYPCSSKDLGYLFSDGSLLDGWPTHMRVSPDGGKLSFYEENISGDGGRMETLYVPGYEGLQLDYLALGDSYASGEGDIAINPTTSSKYYLPFTDVDGNATTPQEKCHLSSRSYPFLLGSMMNLPSYKYESVACSGARISDVAGADDYKGQNNRDGVPRLAMLDNSTLKQYQDYARDNFAPGRLAQVDFIDKYSPKAATLSIGGNDVQFQNILSNCIYSITTCDYAQDPTDLRNLGESIKAMYPKLKETYEEILSNDPGVKLYVTGYPRFVNEDKPTCSLNVNLDLKERVMIDQGVKYINQVIQAAAESVGVKYLDIEDSLRGHRVCDGGDEYVNAISVLGIREKNESFHPNALGHQAIADAISGQLGSSDLVGYNYCSSGSYPCPLDVEQPSLPAFFGDSSVSPPRVAIPTELVAALNILQGVEYFISPGIFAPASSVYLEIHSSPTSLGDFTIPEDGTLPMPITIPASVEDGYHTIHLYGTSPSGEAVDMYQIVYVGEVSAVVIPTSEATNPGASEQPKADPIDNTVRAVSGSSQPAAAAADINGPAPLTSSSDSSADFVATDTATTPAHSPSAKVPLSGEGTLAKRTKVNIHYVMVGVVLVLLGVSVAFVFFKHQRY